METRRLGSLEVSVVGLGTNTFGNDIFPKPCDQATATAVVQTALDVGINFIDTAEEYSVVSHLGTGHSEEFIGVALGSRRDEAVIATKFENVRHLQPDTKGAKRIIEAVEGSLQRLQTDRIDLYQQHFPDPDTPREEILEALDTLVRDGKVIEIGCSNDDGAMLEDALAISEARGFAHFVSVQNRYNVLEEPRQEGIVDAASRHGLKLLPYFPLAAGLLTGKYRRGQAAPEGSRMSSGTAISDRLQNMYLEDQLFDKVEMLEAFAAERGHTILELAFSWLASQPVVGSIIAGATSAAQVRSNATSVSWKMTEDDLGEIAKITA
jgi:aryl-alcohol dehydrogenase-like predicted oxidoreductase